MTQHEPRFQECDGCGTVCEVGDSVPCYDSRCAWIPIETLTHGKLDDGLPWSIVGGEVSIEVETQHDNVLVNVSLNDTIAMQRAITIARATNAV